MVQRCKTPDLVLEPETFALKIQHLVLSVKSKTFSLARIRISDILGEVLTAVRVNHVKMEGDFVNTILSILLLEGIGRRLDPELDLFQSEWSGRGCFPLCGPMGGWGRTMDERRELTFVSFRFVLPSSSLEGALPILRQVGGRAMAGSGNDDELDGVGVKDLGAMIKVSFCSLLENEGRGATTNERTKS